jgi:hypothetical protein
MCYAQVPVIDRCEPPLLANLEVPAQRISGWPFTPADLQCCSPPSSSAPSCPCGCRVPATCSVDSLNGADRAALG